MHDTLIELWGIRVTWWKVIGYAGVFIFSARWFFQLWASREARKPVVPPVFWIMSMVGSLMCLAYFVFGKNDSVGILAYLFPSAVSAYNLYLEVNHRRNTSKLAVSPQSTQAAAPTGDPQTRDAHKPTHFKQSERSITAR